MPIPYLTGQVVGRFLSVVADSVDDLDQEPEVVPMSGTVTFTPQVSAVKVVEGADEPATVNVATISAEIDEQGYLSRNGQRGIRLLASDGPTNPTGFTYQVTFALSLGKGAAAVKYQPFAIQVPSGGTTDLTVAAPVPSSSGASMVQGVGVQDVTVENGEFVFHLTNGAETRAPLPAVSGEAMVSVSTVEPGHYTVNGVSIMGLTETGALPPTATSEVQSIADASASSAVLAVSENVTLVESRVKALENTPAPSAPEPTLRYLGDGTYEFGGSTPPDTGGVTPTPLPDTIARRFVVLGDSHSDYTPPSDAGTWWWQVAADRAGLIAVDNFAARGWDTQQAIDGAEGMPSQVTRAEQSPGDLALVMFGGNDVVHGFTVAKYESNLEVIINRLKASGKRVVIVFPPPLFSLLNLEHGTQYAQMRERARVVAAENGAYYTDAWSVMASPEGTSDPSWDSGDTVHLNDEGQRVMGMAVAAALQSFAAVADPLGGEPRLLDWARDGNRSATGNGQIVRETSFAEDPLFRSSSVARVTGGSGETVVYADTGAVPGERIRVEYAYRVTVPAAVNSQKGLTDMSWSWPSGATSARLGSTRVAMEGVRRHEIIVPEDAPSGFVVGAGLVDTTDAATEVLIGPARVTVVTPEGRPYRLVELPALAEPEP